MGFIYDRGIPFGAKRMEMMGGEGREQEGDLGTFAGRQSRKMFSTLTHCTVLRQKAGGGRRCLPSRIPGVNFVLDYTKAQ
jgi:hypothetical protein